MQMAVRPASVGRGACALAAVTIAAENACASSCSGSGQSRCVRQKLVSANSHVRGCPAGKIQRSCFSLSCPTLRTDGQGFATQYQFPEAAGKN